MTYPNPVYRVDGDTIPAQDHNSTAERAVWRFATLTERDSVNPTPQAGDVCYVIETNRAYVWGGQPAGWQGVPFTYEVDHAQYGVDTLEFLNSTAEQKTIVFPEPFTSPPFVTCISRNGASQPDAQWLLYSTTAVTATQFDVIARFADGRTLPAQTLDFAWFAYVLGS